MIDVGMPGRRTEKAMQFTVGGELLWLPKRALRETVTGFKAPKWAIDAAKRLNVRHRP